MDETALPPSSSQRGRHNRYSAPRRSACFSLGDTEQTAEIGIRASRARQVHRIGYGITWQIEIIRTSMGLRLPYCNSSSTRLLRAKQVPAPKRGFGDKVQTAPPHFRRDGSVFSAADAFKPGHRLYRAAADNNIICPRLYTRRRCPRRLHRPWLSGLNR